MNMIVDVNGNVFEMLVASLAGSAYFYSDALINKRLSAISDEWLRAGCYDLSKIIQDKIYREINLLAERGIIIGTSL